MLRSVRGSKKTNDLRQMREIPGIPGLLPVLAFPVKAQTGPDTTPEIVARAAAAGARVPPGKFSPTWDSPRTNVSHHGIEHFTFIRPTKGLATDLDDTNRADFYSVADHSDGACEKFLEGWVAQNKELIDKYQPDILWFDNGVNGRVFDPLKLKVAAYYYNRAATWDKAVSLSTKGCGAADGPAHPAGSIMDFDRSSRMPKEVTDFPRQVDEPGLYRFGYTENSPIASAAGCVRVLVEATSKNGALPLNISPQADGTIPDDQQKFPVQIGAWLAINGEAIHATRPWTKSGEGGNRGFRFTTKGDMLYALSLSWPASEAVITSLATTNSPAGKPKEVELLGHPGKLEFSQDETGSRSNYPPTSLVATPGRSKSPA